MKLEQKIKKMLGHWAQERRWEKPYKETTVMEFLTMVHGVAELKNYGVGSRRAIPALQITLQYFRFPTIAPNARPLSFPHSS